MRNLTVAIKGAGDLASGVAWRLYQARIRRLYMLELALPRAVRRCVAYSEAVHDGAKTVEGVTAVRIDRAAELSRAWAAGNLAVLVDPDWKTVSEHPPDIVIDAILAKRNLGTCLDEAPLVIGLGPGFVAGRDVHRVIETRRGHNLGRVFSRGSAAKDTGVPGNIGGYTTQRVLRSPGAGIFQAHAQLGDTVTKGAAVGLVDQKAVRAQISGILRGLIRDGTPVSAGEKVGDIDPRGHGAYCASISDKARSLGGAVLEAILHQFNT